MPDPTVLDLYANAQPIHFDPLSAADDVGKPIYDVTPYLAAPHYAPQLSLLSLLRQRDPVRSRSVTDAVAVDLFAGGGGASLGIEQATDRSPLVAVNHDWHAIQMHMENHPLSIHFHRDVWEVPPRGAVNGAKIDLLWASPACDHFSSARGGKPVEKHIRALAWVIIEWAFEVRPTVIAGENVGEFLGWGPIFPNTPDIPEKLRNRPIKDRMGETFDAFRLALGPGVPETHPSWGEIPERVREYARRGCGYDLRTAVLTAADYGVPTTRERLYFVARCDGEAIRFPEPTHGPGRAEPYRTAAECLDFEEPSLSIFASPEEARAWAKARKTGIPRRPLAGPTLRRIAEGVRRYVLENIDPFIVVTGHQSSDGGKVRPVSGPLSTIVTKAEHLLVTPVLTKFYGASVGAPVDAPSPTHTERAHLGVVEPLLAPVLTKFYSTSKVGASIESPMPTVTAQSGGGHLGVVEPVLSPSEMSTPLLLRAHGKGWDRPGKASGVTKPGDLFPTVIATEEWAVMTPILVRYNSERDNRNANAHQVEDPLPTVPTENRFGLVSAFLTKHYGGLNGHQTPGAPVVLPMSTVTERDHHALVQADLIDPYTTPVQPDRREMVAAFLVLYYGSGGQWQSLSEPMKTIVSKARLGIVEVVLGGVPYVITDIRMRRLTPRELARAQGFPDSYKLTGTKAQQIARIGNSVCPAMARAIVEANFGPRGQPATT